MNAYTNIELQIPQANADLLADDFWHSLEFQFSIWRLTMAERDVAMCLLLGLSNKQIANKRKTTERTVRAQAHAIYAKTSLDGRHRLTGFFFGKLLKP